MKWGLAFIFLGLLQNTAHAERYYKVSVTREESNFYRIDQTRMYIHTKYCYEYAYAQNAVLVWRGNGAYAGSELIFLGFDGSVSARCDVVSLLSETIP